MPKTASCAKRQANFPVFPSTFSLGYFNSTSSIVHTPFLSIAELGRLLLLEAIVIGSNVEEGVGEAGCGVADGEGEE